MRKCYTFIILFLLLNTILVENIDVRGNKNQSNEQNKTYQLIIDTKKKINVFLDYPFHIVRLGNYIGFRITDPSRYLKEYWPITSLHCIIEAKNCKIRLITDEKFIDTFFPPLDTSIIHSNSSSLVIGSGRGLEPDLHEEDAWVFSWYEEMKPGDKPNDKPGHGEIPGDGRSGDEVFVHSETKVEVLASTALLDDIFFLEITEFIHPAYLILTRLPDAEGHESRITNIYLGYSKKPLKFGEHIPLTKEIDTLTNLQLRYPPSNTPRFNVFAITVTVSISLSIPAPVTIGYYFMLKKMKKNPKSVSNSITLKKMKIKNSIRLHKRI